MYLKFLGNIKNAIIFSEGKVELRKHIIFFITLGNTVLDNTQGVFFLISCNLLFDFKDFV